MRVVISGASGFLGQRLTRWLGDNGHEVTRLVRRTPAGDGEIEWDPGAGVLDPAALAPHDAVVNLSGANIGEDGRQLLDPFHPYTCGLEWLNQGEGEPL